MKIHFFPLFIVSVIGWFVCNALLARFDSGISPEFLVMPVIVIFKICIAAFLTFTCDKWIAPTIDRFTEYKMCQPDRGGRVYKSEFEKAWHENPKDPRIAYCLIYYTLTFIALVLAFNL